MIAQKSSYEIKCEHCGNVYKDDLVSDISYINIKEDYQDLIDRKYCKSYCQYCKKEFIFNRPITYRNDLDSYILKYVTSKGEFINVVGEFMLLEKDKIFSSYKKRVIFDRFEIFVEKILIFSLGLNDKIIELNKLDELEKARRYYPHEFLLFVVESKVDFKSLLFKGYCFNNEVKYFDYDEKRYKDVIRNYADKKYLKRESDFVITSNYTKIIVKNNFDVAPYHLELLLSKKRDCIQVEFPYKNQQLWYEVDYEMLGAREVLVPFDKHEEKAYVVQNTVITEIELGFSFSKLKTPIHIYFEKKDLERIAKNMVIETQYGNLEQRYFDICLDDINNEHRIFYVNSSLDNGFEKFNINDVFYYKSNLYVTKERKELKKDTRVIILSSDFEDEEYFKEVKMNASILSDSYYKVLNKYSVANKKFIVLLHLYKPYWHITSLIDNSSSALDKYNLLFIDEHEILNQFTISNYDDNTYDDNTHDFEYEFLDFIISDYKPIKSPVKIKDYDEDVVLNLKK